MYDKSLRTSAVITARDCFNYDIIAGISLNRPLGDGRISASFASTHGTEYGWSPKSCYVVPLCRLRNGMSDQANRLQKQEWFKSRLLISFRAWLLNFARKKKLHHRKVILYTILSVIYLLASRNFLQSLNSLKSTSNWQSKAYLVVCTKKYTYLLSMLLFRTWASGTLSRRY